MFGLIKAHIPNRWKRNSKGFVRNISDSFEYYTGPGIFLPRRSPLENRKIKTIIFVCKGNVCRSVFAEYRLKSRIDIRSCQIDSCGIDGNQGNYPPHDSADVAAEFGCMLANRRAKNICECDMDKADLILAMEYWHYKRLVEIYPEKKENILLLRSLAPFPSCVFCNIADPYGWGKKEFRKVYRLIDRTLNRLITWC